MLLNAPQPFIAECRFLRALHDFDESDGPGVCDVQADMGGEETMCGTCSYLVRVLAFSTATWLLPHHSHRSMAEASSSKTTKATTKAAPAATDDIEKILAQEESAFQRDFEVSIGGGWARRWLTLIVLCLTP